MQGGTGTILSANLDGTGRQDLLTVDGDVQALAVDAVGGRMYWSEGDTIRSANLDGSGREDLEVEASGADALAVDAVRRKIYWSYFHHDDDYRSGIRRVDLDGTGQRDLGLEASYKANALAIDAAGGKLYWDDDDTIRSANLDGSGQTTVVTGVYADGIALGIR